MKLNILTSSIFVLVACNSRNYNDGETRLAGNSEQSDALPAVTNEESGASLGLGTAVLPPRPLTGPNITSSTGNGLRLKLSGTCDVTATNHKARTTLGVVQNVTCKDGILSILIHLPAGPSMSFSVTATSERSDQVADSRPYNVTRSAFLCPSGYVGVPASEIPLLGNTKAQNGNSIPWLDTTRDFCVMKYPAKKGSTGAVSVSEGLPWVNIIRGNDVTTSNSALKACRDLGANYRLISNMQWQTIARNAENEKSNWSGTVVGSGVLARGHSDNSPNTALANSIDSDPYFGTGNTASVGWEQRRTRKLSNGEVVWDIGGNIYQMVSDLWSAIGLNPVPSLNWRDYEYSETSVFPAGSQNRLLLAPGGPFDSRQNAGVLRGGSSLTTSILVRGGSFNLLARTGSFLATAWESGASATIGFRCTYVP